MSPTLVNPGSPSQLTLLVNSFVRTYKRPITPFVVGLFFCLPSVEATKEIQDEIGAIQNTNCFSSPISPFVIHELSIFSQRYGLYFPPNNITAKKRGLVMTKKKAVPPERPWQLANIILFNDALFGSIPT
ncbi:hypothetical protein [Vibrio misgurnus]|uniref:hypothetical protein n=1 Tax=Vibrio misgurnus TaxID=2993714 RepID=UPI002417B7F5|nr:hypothetical protein [Vibrio sp. gvc]